jgi:hypothetical protein
MACNQQRQHKCPIHTLALSSYFYSSSSISTHEHIGILWLRIFRVCSLSIMVSDLRVPCSPSCSTTHNQLVLNLCFDFALQERKSFHIPHCTVFHLDRTRGALDSASTSAKVLYTRCSASSRCFTIKLVTLKSLQSSNPARQILCDMHVSFFFIGHHSGPRETPRSRTR